MATEEPALLPSAWEASSVASSVHRDPLVLRTKTRALPPPASNGTPMTARVPSDESLTPVPLPILPAAQHYVFLSYDNVLLERRADGLHVVLPQYGVTALDELARERWERIGARVRGVRVDGLFRLGGSIRCLVAPLRRAPA